MKKKNISTLIHTHTQEAGDSGCVQMRLGAGPRFPSIRSEIEPCMSRGFAAASVGEFKSAVGCLQLETGRQ